MIVEIEYFKGDTLLYGKNISEAELKEQIQEVKNSYDRNEDNFIDLFCRRFQWTVLKSDDIPDFTYDRDVERLYPKRKKEK